MTSARLYLIGPDYAFWYGDVDGTDLVVRRGAFATGWPDRKEERTSHPSASAARDALVAASAARRAEGYTDADGIDSIHLPTVLFSHARATVEPGDEEGPFEAAFFGGPPPLLGRAKWPREGSTPMGHLVTVSGPDPLDGFVDDIAVFVPPGPGATDPERTVCVPIRRRKLGFAKPPKGARLVERRPVRGEVVEGRDVAWADLAGFLAEDPVLDARVRAFAAEQPPWPDTLSRRAWSPRWLHQCEHPTSPDGTRDGLAAQIDFDGIDPAPYEAAWPGADIRGVLYVFVRYADQTPYAIWQQRTS